MLGLCLLTLNAGDHIERWREAVSSQSLQPDRILVIDSASTDNTAMVARDSGYEVVSIARSDFGHGRTRHLAFELLYDCDVLVFMTQDAILADVRSLQTLAQAFDNPEVAVAYGRQLPHPKAGPIARHAREYNYPPDSELRTLQPGERPGIQVAFCSDSFAAYRRETLEAVGGFPKHVFFGEDMYVAAKSLLLGSKVAYVAGATAFHSHDYTLSQDFRRYFDTGAFHEQESWLLERLGTPESRGAKFVVSELRFLASEAPALIPSALVRVAARYAGYRAGRGHRWLPRALKKRLSMSGQF